MGQKTPPATPQKSTVPERQKRAPTPRFYQFDRTNAVTIKVTDGEKVISEGSLGRDNYKTARAIGWLMEIDGGGWVACVGNRRSKPLPLNKAKDAARDMHRSGSGEVPDDPIRALNLATAGQIDREARKSQMKRTDWPIDLMGGNQRGDSELQRIILETETGTRLKRAPRPETKPLKGDDYPLTYDSNGYPELPACLDRRPKPEIEIMLNEPDAEAA